MNAYRRHRYGLAALLGAAVCCAACDDTQPVEPEAPPVPIVRVVSVTVEYNQPLFCTNVIASCDGAVFFWGSWMLGRGEFALTRHPGTHVWSGTARDVPVNFPPRGQAYLVRVFDPYLTESSTGGPTAERLQVGGQAILYVDARGTPGEAGWIYIDDNGQGRSPF